MACEVTKDNNGQVTAITCSRNPRPPKTCPFCGLNLAIIDCDFPVGQETQSGTCDQDMCHRCATTVGPGKHYCPNHKDKWDGHQFMKPLYGKKDQCALCGGPPNFHKKPEKG